VEAEEVIVAAKGAPEAIADLCHLSAADRDALTLAVNGMAAGGLRTLGVARARFAGQTWPDTQRGFAFELLGLVALADPLRTSVPDAVSQCRSAGIRVVMITGDYPATARAIAGQAGLAATDVVTGRELEVLSDAELADRVEFLKPHWRAAAVVTRGIARPFGMRSCTTHSSLALA